MASNFRNSAGTDLDNLFYVCNANSGNIGFKVSDGTDLGVRYGGGTLGYNVGYKNSAGTDLGYLRGTKKIATTTIKVGTYDDYYGYDYITDLFSKPFGSASPNTVFGCRFALFYVTTGLTDFFITDNGVRAWRVKGETNGDHFHELSKYVCGLFRKEKTE